MKTLSTLALVVCSACSFFTHLDGFARGDAGSACSSGGCLEAGAEASLEGPAADAGGLDADAYDLDADAPDAAPTIAIVQKVIMPIGSATIAPTKAGNLLAVAVVRSEPEGVNSVHDNAAGGSNVYVPTGRVTARESGGASCGTVEVWYAKDIRPGATSVSVEWANGTGFGWIVEVSGVSPSTLVVYEELHDQPAGTVAEAPKVTPSSDSAFVLSAAASCKGLTNIQAGNPFTPLSFQSGDNAAYFITSTSGSYGAAWTSELAEWAGITVAF